MQIYVSGSLVLTLPQNVCNYYGNTHMVPQPLGCYWDEAGFCRGINTGRDARYSHVCADNYKPLEEDLTAPGVCVEWCEVKDTPLSCTTAAKITHAHLIGIEVYFQRISINQPF